MATIPQERAVRHDAPRFDPTPGRVRYSRRWLGAGAGLGLMAGMALLRGGLPAAAAMGVASLAGAVYAVGVEPRHPELTRLTVRLPGLPAALDGLRIGQLSDTHLGTRYAATNTAWAVAALMGEQPDVIAITGDFVSYEHAIDGLPGLLSPLAAPLGVYAVPGNHDYWEGLATIRSRLEPLGVRFLINRGEQLRWRGGAFFLAGIDDIWDGRPDLDAALANRPADMPTVLLSHAPDIADAAAASGVSLQLSGHTHGGHMRLPYLGPFCLPRHGWLYAVGHEHVGSMQLYVSRGIAGLPLRLGCRPEATVITLRQG